MTLVARWRVRRSGSGSGNVEITRCPDCREVLSKEVVTDDRGDTWLDWSDREGKQIEVCPSCEFPLPDEPHPKDRQDYENIRGI